MPRSRSELTLGDVDELLDGLRSPVPAISSPRTVTTGRTVNALGSRGVHLNVKRSNSRHTELSAKSNRGSAMDRSVRHCDTSSSHAAIVTFG